MNRTVSFLIAAAGLCGAQGLALAQDDSGTGGEVGVGVGTETTPTPTPEPTPAPSATGYAGLHAGLEGIEIPLFTSDFTQLINAIDQAGGGTAAPSTFVPTADFIWGLGATAAIDTQVGIILDHEPANAMTMTNSSTRFGLALGAGYRMYKTMKGKVRPYLEPGLRIALPDFSKAGDTIAVGAFGQLGVELLLTDQLTVGTHIGATLDFNQKFKQDVIATETGVVDVGFFW